MKELVPGMAVRVEHNARIVGLVEKNNLYWYEIEYPDGRREVVNVARLHWFADTCRGGVKVATTSRKVSCNKGNRRVPIPVGVGTLLSEKTPDVRVRSG